MKRLKLVPPTTAYKTEILEYKTEFLCSNDSMDGTAGLQKYDTFEQWYEVSCKNRKESTALEGFVPASTFLAISLEDNSLVGMIDIRHRLNEYLFRCGGHIGYSVRKSQRNKGYAKEMLELALEECKKLELGKILITCNKDNVASEKTILKNGGVFENEVADDGEVVKRFWIEL